MRDTAPEASLQPSSPADRDRELGQLLVDRAWVSTERVRRAFEAQMLGGGTFGTCLLELGFITEDRLLEALSEVYSLPPASTADLRKLRSNAIAQLPGSVAQRHRAVPFRIVGGELWVALLEPGNEQILQELSDIAQRKLRPHVTTEARLLEALGSYYALPVPQRFVLLLTRLNRPPALWEEAPAKPPRVITLSEEERQALESRPATASQPSPRPASRAVATASRKPAPPPQVATPEQAKLESRLAESEDLDAIGRAVLAALANLADRALLFKVRGEKVYGWMGRGQALDEKALSSFELDFEQPSVFLNLRQGAGMHLGPLPDMPAHRAVAKLWRGELSQAAVVAPILVRGRLVGVFLAERGSQGMTGVDFKALKNAMSACAAALELHLTQRKARKT